MTPVDAAFAANVKCLREERDWSRQDLAREAGISVATISRIEQGNGAHLDTAVLIAGALGVSVDSMVTTATGGARA